MLTYKKETFSDFLSEKIQKKEKEIQKMLNDIQKKYKNEFVKRGTNFRIVILRKGENPFSTPYHSYIFLTLFDTKPNFELLVWHELAIWKCQQTLFGMHVPFHTPFNNQTGFLTEKSMDELKTEIVHYIEKHWLGQKG